MPPILAFRLKEGRNEDFTARDPPICVWPDLSNFSSSVALVLSEDFAQGLATSATTLQSALERMSA